MSNTDISHTISKPADIDELVTLCQGVIGQECWWAHTMFSHVLALDFGAKVFTKSPARLGPRQIGEWILVIHTPEWEIRDQIGQVYCSPENDEVALKALVRVLEHTHISKLDIALPSMAVTALFDNGYQLIVSTCQGFDMYEDGAASEYMPCWELFMPNYLIVDVKQGARRWTYGRSDVPMQ